MTSLAPDVSVIVISYNDAERLSRAVRSVQRQTLRNLEIIVVDDASSDGTAEIVDALAANDPRLRYECLPVNSGGCSAPRNRGVELARGAWIMFCDSDDEYDRHACKNLLQAAERFDADVVCGTAERVDAVTGRTRRWRPETHECERVENGLQAFPELLFDTISVNKIYRRTLLADNGIRFPEGLLFEDQLFTLEALAAARRVAVIPEVVYRWNVDRVSDEPSITQRRHEAANVESRIEINRRIDAFLASRDLHAIQVMKDLKFLKHDLYLYLSSMLVVDDRTALTLMDRLLPYVSTVNLEPAWQLRPALRVAIYHLLVGDLEGVRAAMRFVKWASVVDVPIVGVDGREVWGCGHADSGPTVAGRPALDWLDVTDLHLLSVPFTQRRYLHRLDAMDVRDGEVTAQGSTIDYDASLGLDDAIELRFLIGGARAAVSVPARWSGREGDRLTWRAQGPCIDLLGRALEAKDRGTIGLAISRGGQENVTTTRSPEDQVSAVTVPFVGTTRGTGPDSLVLHPHDNGAVGWRAARTSAGHIRRAAVRDAWFRVPGTRWLAESTALVREALLPRLAYALGALLPSRSLALFETGGGRTADGNARAISDYLAAHHGDIEQAWVWRDEPYRLPGFARPVQRLSLRHVWLAARARYWIEDGSAPMSVRTPPRVATVFAGWGVPVHRVGLDDPSVLVSRADVRDVRRRSRRWNVFLSASTHDALVTPAALAYAGAVAETGLARMDAVLPLAGDRTEERRRRKVELDLPLDRPVILYAPTLRAADRRGEPPLLDLDEWAARLGDRCYLLLRPPPRERFSVSSRLRFAVRDIGDRDDVQRLIGAADLVISDYSSLIGDAALADLPIIAFQPDREVYVNRTHGLYPVGSSAGPIVESMAALFAQVESWLADPAAWDGVHGPGRAAFARDLCGPADGQSTRRAVGVILGAASGSEGAS